MFNTKHYIKYNNKYTNSCYLSFSHSFKPKTGVIVDYKLLLVTELNKFGVIGLLHFHKRILPSHRLNFTLYGCWGKGLEGGGDTNLRLSEVFP